jgi:hypothetical protein
LKIEWHCPFEANGFYFDKERTFKATSKGGTFVSVQEDLEFEVKICLDTTTPEGIDQCGTLIVTLPMNDELGESVAYQFAAITAEKLSFQGGHFSVGNGYVISKRIAETPEEEKEIGDNSCSLKLNLIEVISPPVFDVTAFTESSHRSADIRLMAQFNETCRDASLIRQFLGFFRIIESAVEAENPKMHLKDAIKANSRLRSFFLDELQCADFDAFVENAVERRHECAHLRLGKNFGYVPNDPRLESEVRPLVPLLQALARLCVEN